MKGRVLCWGYGEYGELGNGAYDSLSAPARVIGIRNAASVTAGFYDTCATLSTGKSECWGDGAYGELGNNNSDNDTDVPVALTGISKVTAISASELYTCVATSDHAVYCFGSDQYGQLGNGHTGQSAVPVAAKALSAGAVAIGAGYYRTCALVSGGHVQCWGYGLDGELGNGSIAISAKPAHVTGISGAESVVTGEDHTCALLHTGLVDCWGADYYNQLADGISADALIPTRVVGLAHVTAISSDAYHTCAVTEGHVRCWGWNEYGQLGNGTTSEESNTVQVTGLSSATEVAAGYDSSCAIVGAGGSVDCWGDNESGQLGNGTTNSSSVPVPVVGLSNAISIGIGDESACALDHGRHSEVLGL